MDSINLLWVTWLLYNYCHVLVVGVLPASFSPPPLLWHHRKDKVHKGHRNCLMSLSRVAEELEELNGPWRLRTREGWRLETCASKLKKILYSYACYRFLRFNYTLNGCTISSHMKSSSKNVTIKKNTVNSY